MVSKYIPLLNPTKPPKAPSRDASVSAQPHQDKEREKNIWVIKSELASDSVNLKRLAELISKDAGLAAHLLAIANSSYFGLRRHTDSIKDAVLILGLDATRRCVIDGSYLTNGAEAPTRAAEPGPPREVGGLNAWSMLFSRSDSDGFSDTTQTGYADTVPYEPGQNRN